MPTLVPPSIRLVPYDLRVPPVWRSGVEVPVKTLPETRAVPVITSTPLVLNPRLHMSTFTVAFVPLTLTPAPPTPSLLLMTQLRSVAVERAPASKPSPLVLIETFSSTAATAPETLVACVIIPFPTQFLIETFRM